MHHFSSQGVDIAYIDEAPSHDSKDQPILLIHGFASNHAINWVFPQWVKTLTSAGRRVIALDNRGHGKSEKLYNPEQYATPIMAQDACNLLDHLGLERADVMGYSMGARITSFLALNHPNRVRSAILGGLGHHLVEGVGLPMGIADAMDAESVEQLTDPMQLMFRKFAESTKSDLAALAACIRGSRQTLTEKQVGQITCPVLVAIGTKDDVAGDPHRLAAMMPNAKALDIPGRDHNLAVGDKVYKHTALEFLNHRP